MMAIRIAAIRMTWPCAIWWLAWNTRWLSLPGAVADTALKPPLRQLRSGAGPQAVLMPPM
jgi:hypothetical protein